LLRSESANDVAAGMPQEIVKSKRSYTGQFLRDVLERRPAAAEKPRRTPAE
jgi:excinuclease ABC subunit A